MAIKKKQSKPTPKLWQDVVPASMLPKSRLRKPMKTVEIRISLPLLFQSVWLKKRIGKVPKKVWQTLFVLIALAIIGLGAYKTYVSPNTSILPIFTTDENSGDKPQPIHTGGTTPDYATIEPAGKSVKDLGGWVRVSPTTTNPVFAYADHIGNIPINVSQQPIPDEFGDDIPAQIDQLAIGYNANEKITVEGVTVHIGTSAKGPQSVIFTKDNLLILIKSAAKISNDEWAAYVSSLQ